MSFRVRGTQNFRDNVREIENYLSLHGNLAALVRFSEDMGARVTPLLERTPGVGAPFREASSLGQDAQFVLKRVAQRLEARELRQIVSGQFVVLYVVSTRAVHLLAVRHHRQVAFRLG